MVSTIFFSCNTDNKDLAVDKTNNRITQLISASKNSKNDTTIRASKLHEAYELNKNIKNDSIQLNHLIGLSNAAYRLKKINLFKKINFEVLTKAIETNDTYGIAKAHQYTGFYFLNEEINDSAYFYYYNSHRLYKSIKKEKNVATTLHNMALIHARLKDYTASTEILFNVVTIHKKFKNHKSLYNSNTILGSIYRGIEDYENSFKIPL